jgi:hypothetical protein
MTLYLRDFWTGQKIPTKDIPQANRLDVVVDIVCGAKWPSTSIEIAEFIAYRPRQGAYYADAAELLGLIERRASKWVRTPRGEHFCNVNLNERKELLREYVSQVPIVSIALRLVESMGVRGISSDELTKKMLAYSGLDRSTPRRRVECILSWLRQLGYVTRTKTEEVRFVHHIHNPQMRLV